jgi:hypothetical protein
MFTPPTVCRQRIDRVFGIIFGTQQSGFLSGHRKEDDAAVRCTCFLVRFGKRNQRSGAGGVINGAVADFIAINRRAAPQMVPMPGVEHIFIRALGALQYADDVAAVLLGDGIFKANTGFQP